LISSLCTVFDFFSILFLISSLYCFWFQQYREEIKNSTEKKSKTV
jgi:hypothetical protein